MLWILQIFFALVITYLFIKRERPNPFFLIFGYFFFLLTLLIKLPFQYLEFKILEMFTQTIIPLLILGTLSLILIELLKYFSLKRYVRTKSYKNGILFGIGWATLESIDYIKILFFDFISSYLTFDLSYLNLVLINQGFFNYMFFFILNLSVTVLIIISIIKKNKFYLLFGIIFYVVVLFGFNYLDGIYRLPIIIFALVYSTFIIFHYKKIK